jgi:hypothetical protein
MFNNRSFYLFLVMAILGVTACTPGAEPDKVWSEGPFPNGTWTTELSTEDFAAMGISLSSEDAAGWTGVSTFIFQDGRVVYRHEGDFSYDCEGTYEAVEDFVRVTYADTPDGVCNGVVEDVRWRLEEDGLHFQLIAAMNIPFELDQVGWEAKPWQKVAD